MRKQVTSTINCCDVCTNVIPQQSFVYQSEEEKHFESRYDDTMVCVDCLRKIGKKVLKNFTNPDDLNKFVYDNIPDSVKNTVTFKF